jgi:xanthine/uracil permease
MVIECLRDLTAASDVLGLLIEGTAFEERSQGGLLCDGVSIILSGLCSTMGVITYSNNNGVNLLLNVLVERLVLFVLAFLFSAVCFVRFRQLSSRSKPCCRWDDNFHFLFFWYFKCAYFGLS